MHRSCASPTPARQSVYICVLDTGIVFQSSVAVHRHRYCGPNCTLRLAYRGRAERCLQWKMCVMSSIIFSPPSDTEHNDQILNCVRTKHRAPFSRSVCCKVCSLLSACKRIAVILPTESCLSSERARASRVKCTQTFSDEDGATTSASRQPNSNH